MPSYSYSYHYCYSYYISSGAAVLEYFILFLVGILVEYLMRFGDFWDLNCDHELNHEHTSVHEQRAHLRSNKHSQTQQVLQLQKTKEKQKRRQPRYKCRVDRSGTARSPVSPCGWQRSLDHSCAVVRNPPRRIQSRPIVCWLACGKL